MVPGPLEATLRGRRWRGGFLKKDAAREHVSPTRHPGALATVEYGIILAAIAIVIVVGVFWFGSALEPWLSALARVVTDH